MAMKEWIVYARKSCSTILVRPVHSTYIPSGYRAIGKVMANRQSEAIDMIWTRLQEGYSQNGEHTVS